MSRMKMVVGFMFNVKETDVLLIEKQKTEWQRGRFNGIGGKVEKEESFLSAMIREFKEEVGILQKDWDYVITLYGDDWELQVFTCKSNDVFHYKQMEDEEPVLIRINELDNYNVLSNLYWLIPMSLNVSRMDYNLSRLFVDNENKISE